MSVYFHFGIAPLLPAHPVIKTEVTEAVLMIRLPIEETQVLDLCPGKQDHGGLGEAKENLGSAAA